MKIDAALFKKTSAHVTQVRGKPIRVKIWFEQKLLVRRRIQRLATKSAYCDGLLSKLSCYSQGIEIFDGVQLAITPLNKNIQAESG